MSRCLIALVASAAFGAAMFGSSASLAATDPRAGPLPVPLSRPPAARPPASNDAEAKITLLIAVQKTVAPRSSDTLANARQHRLPSVEKLVWLRGREDENFVNKTRNLARLIGEDARGFRAPAETASVSTGAEFLDALILASRHGPLGNVVIYGHSAPNALYMREDRGFYREVGEMADEARITPSPTLTKREELRVAGARELADLENLIRGGVVRFAPDAVIVFAGCDAAGRRDLETAGIAARVAEITGATAFASIGVTDQSMAAGGRPLPEKEYSRGTWVRFGKSGAPAKLNAKVLDVLAHLNADGVSSKITNAPAGPPDADAPVLPQFRCSIPEANEGRLCRFDAPDDQPEGSRQQASTARAGRSDAVAR